MTWWILTRALPLKTFNTLTIRTYTNIDDHLFMSWSYFKPRRHPIYRTVRGVEKLCGFRYIWDTPSIVEQHQFGDTSYHTFALVELNPLSTIWYYLHAPGGPYGLEIQGPLCYETLPGADIWLPKLYVATKLKGVYWTRSFSGPAEPQPEWISVNGALHSLAIWQFHADLLAPHYRYYALVGQASTRVLYKLETTGLAWWQPFWPSLFPDWVPILTTDQAKTLTGSASGHLAWVSTDINHPYYIYVLFNSGFSVNGTWCIRSLDAGLTWAAFQIHNNWLNYEAGNILAGLRQGLDPLEPGQLVYAALCSHIGASMTLWLSQDNGETWAAKASQGMGSLTPRCLVDPNNHSTIYVGAMRNIANLHELWRSEAYGANLLEIDGDQHLGIMISPYKGTMWVHDTEPAWMRVLTSNHIWHSVNYASTWIDRGLTPETVDLISIRSVAPNNLYLARDHNGGAPAMAPSPHVIFASVDEGTILWPKAGPHADQSDGGGDSIPWDSGGLCQDGIAHPYIP